MQIWVDGLVLREKKMESQDRLLILLTRGQGLLSAYARGAAKNRGRLAGATEQLCFSRFQLFRNRDKTYVDDAECEHVFLGIRQEIEKLALASYFCQLCCELVPEGAEAPEEYLRLMLNSLHFLEQDGMPRLLLKSVFELRILSLSGFMPDLTECACGRMDGPVWFSPRMGCLFCRNCRPASESDSLIPLSPGVLQAMRYITSSEFDKLFRFRLAPDAVRELSAVCRTYLLEQVERMLPALHFYETFSPEPDMVP